MTHFCFNYERLFSQAQREIVRWISHWTIFETIKKLSKFYQRNKIYSKNLLQKRSTYLNITSWSFWGQFRVIFGSFSGHRWPADRLTSVKVMSMSWSHGKSKREVGNRLGYRKIYFGNWGVMSNGSKRNQSQGWKRVERIKNIKSWNSPDWKRSKQGIRFFSWINLRSRWYNKNSLYCFVAISPRSLRPSWA